MMQQVFPYGTDFMSWEDWNGGFIMWFGEAPIPLSSEENWTEAAAAISSLPSFAKYPLPQPYRFETWQEWADEVTQILNGHTNS